MSGASVPAWPQESGGDSELSGSPLSPHPQSPDPAADSPGHKPTQLDALQALLAFASLHDQMRQRKALSARNHGFDNLKPIVEFDREERFVLDDVLRLVAERGVAITGADGLAIALAENNEIVLRAAAGMVRPDVGARIDRDSAFSGACFRMAQVVNCDDTEIDARVNLQACRRLGARSMVAVPLCGRRRVIGVLEAFSTWPFGFNDSDVRNLTLLAELIVGALKPEDEDRFAQSADVAATMLETGVVPRKPAASAPAPSVRPAVVPPAGTAPAGVPPATSPKTEIPASGIPSASIASPIVPSPISAPVAPTPFAATPAGGAIKPLTPAAALVAPSPVLDAPAIHAPATKDAPKVFDATPASTARISDPETRKDVHHDAHKLASALVIESAFAAATPGEPLLTFGQAEPETKTRHLGMPIVLGVILITAFAVGMAYKWKAAQLSNTVGEAVKPQTSQVAAQPAVQGKTSPSSAIPLPAGTNPATAANAATDAASASNEPGPATPQELAKFPRVTGIRHWSAADSSTVVLDLEDQVQYEEHQIANPTRYYYDLRDTQLAAELAGKSIEVGDAFLSRIRVAQPVPGMTRIVLETKAGANFAHPRVSLEPNPYRLVIEVRKPGTELKGAVNLFPNAEAEKARLAIVVPPPTKEDLQMRARVPKLRIVVDAGHGGWDLGTVGRRGLLEKDLVLEITERLGKLLESRLGMEVVYTRQDDNYIPLDERAEIANHAQADLFVSVHANYSDLPSARGVETYYTNSFSAGPKEADARGASSNAKPVTPPPSAADLHERIEQSRRLAASVQRSLYGTLSAENPGLRDRGIKEAGFVVLTESAMPGILAEVSFVSSPTDEQRLRSDGYREEIAEALYKGIARYAVSSKGVKMASAAK
jgi:N-acetylmuramoyl-L-alanine amidase/putative methionine-R-sulfoxide reductase with GAF domain